ncbi:MAG: response regulator [Bryobacterales bacterium]|nr:response regulator [Bryobacterales bacterium]
MAGRRSLMLAGLLVFASLTVLIWAALHRRHSTVLRVGYSDYPPYMQVLAPGKASGFAVEIFSAAARRRHIPIKWIAVDWPVDRALATGAVDMFPFLAISDERRGKFAMSPSWWESNLGLVALKSRALPMEGGEGLRIAARVPSREAAVARQGFPGASIVGVSDHESVVTAVCSGEADAGVATHSLLSELLSAGVAPCRGNALKVQWYPQLTVQYAVAARREFSSEVEALQKEIVRQAIDGSMRAAALRYGLHPTNQMSLFRDLVSIRDYNVILGVTVLVLSVILATIFWQNRRVRQARLAAERARRQAEQALAARTQFIANVSHEIRTPLNGILGMTELLLASPLDEAQREYTEAVNISGQALLGMINQLLDFSKIDAGKMDLERTEFSPLHVVEEIATLFSAKAAEKNLEIVSVAHPMMPRTVVGDAGRLRQVLSNLTSNAIKFTESGSVLIEASLIERSASMTTLRFVVEDTGIGIPAAFHEKLFEPFSQLDTSSTRRFGGTGLGLSICRELVHLMGGSIGFDGERKQGASFWITIPFSLSRASTDTMMRLAKGGLRILCVDPNPHVRRALRIQLETWGASVLEASSLAEAEGVAEKTFHLAFLGGDQPLKKFRERFEGCIPIVLVSPRAGSGIAARSEEGAHFLHKPVRQLPLWNCILQAIGNLPAGTEPQGAGYPANGARVLVVEDNTLNQKVIVHFLHRLGCEATVVCNGQEAVEIAARKAFDLILMDYQMPVLDGVAATRQIRSREKPERRTPIIALTAASLPQDRELCEEAGMDGFLSKPVAFDSLRAVIETLPAASTNPT